MVLPFSDIDDHSVCYKLYCSSNKEVEVSVARETSYSPGQTIVTNGNTKPAETIKVSSSS